jgi:hypothetical protein
MGVAATPLSCPVVIAAELALQRSDEGPLFKFANPR